MMFGDAWAEVCHKGLVGGRGRCTDETHAEEVPAIEICTDAGKFDLRLRCICVGVKLGAPK
jgi:hypothetical protein